jgi:(R,R)-butanediol dehydrogenase/meso-butanediol dehydrogenase/diacetyl reductase
MRAAVFQGLGKGHKIESVRDPVPGRRDVVLKVLRSGICATDMTITSVRERPSPLDSLFDSLNRPGSILGHEIAGEVIGLGADIEYLKLGDLVAPMGFTGCGTCLTCLSGRPDWCTGVYAKMGGFAEFALADERFSVRVPKTLGVDDCVLIEPMATSLHSVSLAPLKPSSRVVVVGAGPIGLGIVHFLREAGVRSIAAVARTRRQEALALELGADSFHAQSDSLAEELTANGAPDIVFDASGAIGVMNQAVSWLRPQGTIIAAGVNPVADDFIHAMAVMKEIRIQYAQSYVKQDFEVLVEQFARGETPLRKLITRRIALGDFPDAFERARTDKRDSKIILEPTRP